MALELIPGDVTIRNIRAGDRRKRLSDGGGLYLLLFVKGASHGWRFDYSHESKRKTLSLGTYPETTLAAARRKAIDAREVVASGRDPSDLRKMAKAEIEAQAAAQALADAGLPAMNSFESVAREWYEVKRGDWAPSYGDKILRRLEVDVFPYIGSMNVASVTPTHLLEVLRRIEARGVIETAHRAHENCGQVFRYAVATNRVTSNPARDLKDALRSPQPVHFPAITDPARLGDLLRAIHGYAGTPVVRAAIALAPMLMLRPGELRFAEWTEIDLHAALWTVPAARMKRTLRGKQNGGPHLVPLPTQAVAIFRELRQLTGPSGFVFRGERHHDRAMSENTVNAALRAMGFAQDEVTGHGFRATARTMLHEQLGFDPNVIEAQLAHDVKDALGRAYNRTTFASQRRDMMQRWADYLDSLRLATRRTTAAPSVLIEPEVTGAATT